MAFSPLRSKFLRHNRSLSLPSKSSSSTHLDESLPCVKGFEASCSSLSSMESSVRGLETYYKGVDDLLLSSHVQKTISQDQKWIDQVLDGCISLLDLISAAKDLVSSTKQSVQELLSSLRRKDADGVRRYLNSRRKSKKKIHKSLKDLRSLRSKSIASAAEKGGEAASDLVHKLRDAESNTIATLESLMCYLAGSSGARQGGWSVVAKLVHPRKDGGRNELEQMDLSLQMSLEGGVRGEEVTKAMKEVDSSIRNLEEELECLFRKLIGTRVLLLNILNY